MKRNDNLNVMLINNNIVMCSFFAGMTGQFSAIDRVHIPLTNMTSQLTRLCHIVP